ncbi:hypothetical protein L226DRAFT_78836 [Lentinus tigrinus ALCF2SS1-7]|uniref:uncharacterized protein n=1 Tax=Lentinus tigrinus ALCF2SS1-7 TaxID=1328758 RepID=UPI00116628F2|nr:hypothetical protein L226DRAFT_78836 [Lentinus tigrinus ALCF2SS1-7]
MPYPLSPRFLWPCPGYCMYATFTLCNVIVVHDVLLKTSDGSLVYLKDCKAEQVSVWAVRLNEVWETLPATGIPEPQRMSAACPSLNASVFSGKTSPFGSVGASELWETSLSHAPVFGAVWVYEVGGYAHRDPRSLPLCFPPAIILQSRRVSRRGHPWSAGIPIEGPSPTEFTFTVQAFWPSASGKPRSCFAAFPPSRLPPRVNSHPLIQGFLFLPQWEPAENVQLLRSSVSPRPLSGPFGENLRRLAGTDASL